MAYLSTHFQMTSHQANCFLGLQIDRKWERRELFMSQPQYIAGILRRFKMSTCFSTKTPADTQSHMTTSMSPTTPEGISSMAGVPYKEAIGSLIYLMMCTRPDIAYAVGHAARFSQNPGKAHWSAVKRILSYLSGTLNHGILFSSKGRAHLVDFTDADYAGCFDSRKSTSGFLFLHLGGAVAWGSRRQTCTATSGDFLHIAASDATKEAIWLRRLLIQIDSFPTKPVRLMCDNQSSIRLVHIPVHHNRTKHIQIRYHFIPLKKLWQALTAKSNGVTVPSLFYHGHSRRRLNLSKSCTWSRVSCISIL